MLDFFKQFLEELQLPLENPILIFSLILLIILLSPVLLRKINIPGIIGLILAGIAIGPYGFHVLANDSAIEMFSTIGLLYIMFIAGLELDLNEFKSNRNRSLVFGLFTFALPLAIGFPVMYYLLEYDFNASLLTASMFATHTLVAYPIVSKMGISKNQAVAVTVGGTILTDTAVLIILAVIIGNSQGSLNQEFWIRLGISLLIFAFVMFFIIPKIAKWFFRKFENEKHSHYIFVLAVVFFAAFLAEAAGVESIIGAFVAGLALNKLIPSSSALMNRIEFLGNSLFIPFFLISVGMLVDVSVIFSGVGAWIIAGTLTAVAIFTKWLAAFTTQKSFGYSKAQRGLIFGLSSAHAAATLAVILVGYNVILGENEFGEPIRLLDDNILNGTIILILITSIVASFATEKAAKKIVQETESEIETSGEESSTSNEHILLPIADVTNFEKLLEFAIFIKDKNSVNPISLLTVVSNNNESEVNILKARNKLDSFVKEASATETNVNVLTTIDQQVSIGISRISKEIMADIIIVGWPRIKYNFKKFTNDRKDNLINSTTKTVFIAKIEKPLPIHKKVVVMAPPQAEKEKGFIVWVDKIAKVAQELSITIEFYCDESTKKMMERVFVELKLTASINYNIFTDWEDFLILGRAIHNDDLIVLVSARKGANSYLPFFDEMPDKIQKHFPENSFMVVFPQRFTDSTIERYDISTEPLSYGIDMVQKLGKGLGNIFKKEEDEDE